MLLQPQNHLPLAIDGRMIGAAGGTGVSSYARGLLRALGEIGPAPLTLTDGAPPQGRITRWARALAPGARPAFRVDPATWLAPDIFRIAQIYFDIHRRLLTVRVPGPPGIMHWTYPVPLRIAGWANVYTVHDVIPLLQPSLSPIDSRRHRRLLDRIAGSATALITVSEAARADIIAALGCPASFVTDCSQVVDPAPSPAALPAGLQPGRYLIVCGSVERRKNIGAILAAYRASGVALPLVIAGPDGWHTDDFAAAMAAPGVIRLPYLAEPILRAAIGRARALLMPSLAEGFGLPVAEAMALGTPVVTSHTGALAETAGGAALLVDPASVADIAAAIGQIVSDDVLHTELAAAGRHNAARFTLDAFAARLAALHRRIAPPALPA